MHCPVCHADDTKVVDSRLAEEGAAVRRRRHCLSCAHRFTTFERVDEVPLVVLKSDGRTEPFDRAKIVAGILAATKGRHVGAAPSPSSSPRPSRTACACRARRSPAPSSASPCSTGCARVDEVAYLRFASVYKNFDAAADFHREIELLTKAAARASTGSLRAHPAAVAGSRPRSQVGEVEALERPSRRARSSRAGAVAAGEDAARS